MKIEQIVVGEFQVNCIIAFTRSCDAIVVDPGEDAGEILACLDRHSLNVGAYMLTHGHMDHISALADLHDKRPAPVYMNRNDAAWAFTRENQMPPFYGIPRSPSCHIKDVTDQVPVDLPFLSCTTIATPGHTPGSVCYYMPDHSVLLTGDTLFAGSVGRTDLPGGDPDILSKSLGSLATLPDDTRIIPGHGPGSTIGAEKKYNYFMRSFAS